MSLRPFYLWLGRLIARRWWLVILAWLVLLVAVVPQLRLGELLQSVGVPYQSAPYWDDVTHDGDLAYLPDDCVSVIGERRLAEAFPHNRAKSRIVLIVAREKAKLAPNDLRLSDRMAARFQHQMGLIHLREAMRLLPEAAPPPPEGSTAEHAAYTLYREALEEALAAFNETVLLDRKYAPATWHRATVHEMLGNGPAAEQNRAEAAFLDSRYAHPSTELLAEVPEVPLPLQAVWTRHTEVVGPELKSEDGQAQLIVLRLTNEFKAVGNIRVMEQVTQVVQEFRQQAMDLRGRDDGIEPGLQIGITGSAAVGGDMLASAAQSIANTELYTIVLVVLILVIVYRSPLLVAVPLTAIAISFLLATSLVAALTQLDQLPGFSWWDFKVFKTTKIFIVVIMFGAGTDYCLFLISRYQEEMRAGWRPAEAIVRALVGVGDALTASALTTILGLAMMAFAEFGKFRYSGPAIGLCLVVALLTCVTLAPAILRGLGRAITWPFGGGGPRPFDLDTVPQLRLADSHPDNSESRTEISISWRGSGLLLWQRLANATTTRPAKILAAAVLLLAPIAWWGLSVEVTYDFAAELSPQRESRRGGEIFDQHFPPGARGPVVMLARQEGLHLDQKMGMPAIDELTTYLYELRDNGAAAPAGDTATSPGAAAPRLISDVRSLAQPLGDPPRYLSPMTAAGRQLLILRNHRLTREVFVAQTPQHQGDIARFELVLRHDPFSLEAAADLGKIERAVQRLAADPDSYWQGAEFTYSGTTAGLRDLRAVTSRDDIRIKTLVVLAVFVVILLILRRPVTCLYLMLSVLFSYYVTIGFTEWFFHMAYGETFQGLDWKVPVFLFVILVAIGQDYNIYLCTRVFEEQSRRGRMEGLRRAVVRTGGIITSCGLIMAGTFVSMTTGSLRGIVQLGFALSLGVFLDTFVVRTVLVPAFLAIIARWTSDDQPP